MRASFRYILAGALVVASFSLLTVRASTAAAATCGTWSRSTVASGLGIAENLAFDGRGRLLVSSQTLQGPQASVIVLRPGHAPRTLVRGVTGPAGLAVAASGVYVATGSTASAGLLNQPSGAVVRIDPETGARRTVVRGLVQPNGLAVLPDGRFVTSRDIGGSTGLSVADPRTGVVRGYGPRSLSSTNGLAWNRAGTRLYVSSTFTASTTITALDPRHPTTPAATYRIAGFGPTNAADDLTVGPDGLLYVALNAAGRIVRVDPRNGSVCTVVDGLPLTSSVRFGAGPGWSRTSLYATSFLGTVTRIAPK